MATRNLVTITHPPALPEIVPYVARLVEGHDNVDLRVVNSTLGRPVMEAHPTPDGRPATMTEIVKLLEAAAAGQPRCGGN